MAEAFIGAVTALLVGTLGAIVVVWQIGRQADHAIAQNRRNEALKLKLKVYEEVAQICERASIAESMLASFVRSFNSNVGLVNQWKSEGIPWSPPRERFPEYQRLDRAFSDAAIEVITATERWQIIDPRIDLFRYAVNSALHDVREAARDYVPFVIRAMPREMPASDDGPPRLFPWQPPDVRTTAGLTEKMLHALDVCGSYFGDMHLEMQNLLLGELFGNKVPAREPLDPKYFALRLDRYEALKAHFETQTPYGQNAQRVFAEVRARLAEERAAATPPNPN